MSWEIAADGLLVRTEAGAKAELRRLGLEVMHADTFHRNDCLIDSVLQSLMHAGFCYLPSASSNATSLRGEHGNIFGRGI